MHPPLNWWSWKPAPHRHSGHQTPTSAGWNAEQHCGHSHCHWLWCSALRIFLELKYSWTLLWSMASDVQPHVNQEWEVKMCRLSFQCWIPRSWKETSEECTFSQFIRPLGTPGIHLVCSQDWPWEHRHTHPCQTRPHGKMMHSDSAREQNCSLQFTS